MSRRGRLGLAGALVLALGAGAALGYVPLRHLGTGKPLFWASGSSVSIVLSSHGSDDLDPIEHEAPLRLAIDAWNRVPGSFARLVEDTSPQSQARTDWQADDLHLVLFDESNASGYFPVGSATVAITPVWFHANGRIVDADVLFNGSEFSFTTTGEPGRFDVQDVAVHELGHLLGFDHSPVGGSSLFPYVSPGLVLHRSLSSDDHMAARARYPLADAARVKGRVVRGDGSPVVRAHVVLRDAAGRTAGAALAGADGRYELESVEPGDYRLFAVPLEGAVTAANLTGSPPVDTDFQPTELASLTVVGGADLQLGDRSVLPDAAVELGRSYDVLPLGATIGASRTLVLRGAGLVPGTELELSDPDLDVDVLGWFGSSVSFRVTVPTGEEPGLVDCEVVTAAGDRALLPGAIEVVPPAPQVAGVAPSTADSAGGTHLVVTGSGFRPGAAVVVGGMVMVDGTGAGATVVDEGTIHVELGPCPPGTYDLLVVDQSGVEGRAVDAVAVGAVPDITSVFPPAGASSGGTTVVVTGTGFDPGLSVAIAGVPQVVTEVVDGRVEFTTNAWLPGGPYPLTITNPVGRSDSGHFSFAPAADPLLVAVSPDSGPAAGGTWVELAGENLRPGLQVLFGADPVTGQGGSPAPAVSFVDGSTLLVMTPPGQGSTSVIVRDADTAQASALPQGFTYGGSGGSSGGGCGSLAAVDGPGGPLLRGAWWMALLLVVCGARVVAVRAQGSGAAR